jgi:hypothetical protein
MAGLREEGNEPSGSKRWEELADDLLTSQEGNLLNGSL